MSPGLFYGRHSLRESRDEGVSETRGLLSPDQVQGRITQGSPCLVRAQPSISGSEMSGKWNSASLSDAGKGRLGAVLHRGTEVLSFGPRARTPYSDWEIVQ